MSYDDWKSTNPYDEQERRPLALEHELARATTRIIELETAIDTALAKIKLDWDADRVISARHVLRKAMNRA